MPDLLLTFLLALLGGVIGSLGHKWGLERKVSQLEFDLYSAIERINTEVKRRASLAGKKAKEFDDTVIQAASQNPTVQPPQPWWMPWLEGKNVTRS